MRYKFILILIVILGIGAGGIFYYAGKNHIESPVYASEQGDLTVDQTHHATSMNQEVFNGYFTTAPSFQPSTDEVYSGVTPHHLVAGKYMAGFFESIKKQNP